MRSIRNVRLLTLVPWAMAGLLAVALICRPGRNPAPTVADPTADWIWNDFYYRTKWPTGTMANLWGRFYSEAYGARVAMVFVKAFVTKSTGAVWEVTYVVSARAYDSGLTFTLMPAWTIGPASRAWTCKNEAAIRFVSGELLQDVRAQRLQALVDLCPEAETGDLVRAIKKEKAETARKPIPDNSSLNH